MINVIFALCVVNESVIERVNNIIARYFDPNDSIFLVHQLNETPPPCGNLTTMVIPIVSRARSLLDYLRASIAYIVDKSLARATVVVDLENDQGYTFDDIDILAAMCADKEYTSFEEIVEMRRLAASFHLASHPNSQQQQ